MPSPANEHPLFCDRCTRQLTPGQGDFYVVKIEASADPAPPDFSKEDLNKDLRGEIGDLIAQMEDLSERELVDQVHRRVTIYLCNACYRAWIENPTG